MSHTDQANAKSVWLLRSCAALLLLTLGGCTIPVSLEEQYLRPAEVNMKGKKNVRIEHGGAYKTDSQRVADRLKTSLEGRGFSVIDRDAMDAIAAEQFLSDSEMDMKSADALIKVSVLDKRESKEQEREQRDLLCQKNRRKSLKRSELLSNRCRDD